MQQQTITMMTDIAALAGPGLGQDINNNNQHSTGTMQLPAAIIKSEDLNDPQQHQQQQQQNLHQFNQQLQQPLPPTHLQPQQQPQQPQQPQQQLQLHQQQPPAPAPQPPQQQNGPKPRGRRKKIRTEPIRPVCPLCEKQFSNQSALTKHKLTHSDERKFACLQCSKAFKRHDHLTGHMQTHSNRKPFNCTIQGCDKTYCDARSLRRHKENIHHIVTQTQEPSHLLRRRIQRLHSDQSGYNRNVEHHQLNCVTAPPHSLPPQTSLTPQQVTTTTTTTPTPNGNSNSSSSSSGGGSNHQGYLSHHHGHVNQHGSYSADYASTQHFSFDFVPVNGAGLSDAGQSAHLHGQHPQPGSHHNPHQHNHHHPRHPNAHHPHHASSLDQVAAGNNRAVPPHSADSITDSGLSLNMRYEELTPQPLPPPPPPASRPYQQHQRQAPQQYISYSAGYQPTEHFDFDFVSSNKANSNHHQSASFEFDQMNTHHGHHHHTSSLDQISGGPSLPPHSADSIADSGLGLNMRYEELTPQQLAPPPPPSARPYQHHHRQPQQHNVSYSAGYQSNEHFDFDFVTSTSNNNHHQSTSFDFEQMNNHVCANE